METYLSDIALRVVLNSLNAGMIFLLITIIKEVGKSKRINQFKKIDDCKIRAIGNYEKKSKIKSRQFFFWKTKKP